MTATLALALLTAAAPVDSFPHRAHARLFPSCLGCHTGIASGDSTRARPAATACAACHDGAIAARVTWQPRAARPTNLRFDHRAHTEGTCVGCHATGASGAFMDVDRARPETCIACHTPRAASHMEARCESCHRPLRAATTLTISDIARFERPASHDGNFVFSHRNDATSATCAFCHTRESCVSCHVNTETVPAIAALGSDARVAALVAMRPPFRLPRPASHGSIDFRRSHREAAATGETTCRFCHAPVFCASCHDGRASPVFHAANYVARHGAESFGNTLECTTCHQTEAFCATCHRETGRASQSGATAGRYHDAQPNWRFGHGGVARRAIESCASCHRQNDCLQCHSASRGQRVNPHGPGFDPSIESRNRALCLRCHITGAPRR